MRPFHSALTSKACEKAASEITNDYYTIEKLNISNEWQVIGETDASGFSNQPLSYYSEDEHPKLGYNYYRLKQYDFDGSHYTSDERLVVFDQLNKIEIYPNPANDKFIIQGKNLQSVNITITDAAGKIVLLPFSSSSANTIEFDSRNLANGLYYIKTNNDTKPEIFKIVVNH